MISVSPSSRVVKASCSGRHGIRTHISFWEALISSEARQTVSGYLPLLVDPPRVELGSPPRQGGVFPLDHEPNCFEVDLMGVEPTTPTLQGSVAPSGMQAHSIKRSVRELNPAYLLTTQACCRNTYRPIFSK